MHCTTWNRSRSTTNKLAPLMHLNTDDSRFVKRIYKPDLGRGACPTSLKPFIHLLLLGRCITTAALIVTIFKTKNLSSIGCFPQTDLFSRLMEMLIKNHVSLLCPNIIMRRNDRQKQSWRVIQELQIRWNKPHRWSRTMFISNWWLGERRQGWITYRSAASSPIESQAVKKIGGYNCSKWKACARTIM